MKIRNNRGVALAATLIILVMLALLITGMVLITGTQMDLQATGHESTQALYLAEAGVNKLITEFKRPGGVTPISNTSGSFATGTYEAAADHVDTYDFDTDVTGTGYYDPTGTSENPGPRRITRSVAMHLYRRSSWAWDHVLASPSEGGGAGIDHATITSPDENGPLELTTDQLPRPDWDKYHELVAGNTLRDRYGDFGSEGHTATAISYKGKRGKTTYTWTPDGVLEGIYYVHGDIEISRHTIINGTLIATGNIIANANPDVTITIGNRDGNPYPALMALGEIKLLSGHTEVNGIVWAAGQITVKTEVNGSVISLTGIDVGQGGADVTYGIGSMGYYPGENPPPFFTPLDPIGGWKFKVKNWRVL